MRSASILLPLFFILGACGVTPPPAVAPTSHATPSPSPSQENKTLEAESEEEAIPTRTTKAWDALSPIECPEGSYLYQKDLVEGCLTELANHRVVPNHRWKEYYSNGMLKTYREYLNGIPWGNWKAWREHGYPEVVSLYENGMLKDAQFYSVSFNGNIVLMKGSAFEKGALISMTQEGGDIKYVLKEGVGQYTHVKSDGSNVARAEIRDSKITFSQGSPSRILLGGMFRMDLGRFAHAIHLSSRLKDKQLFSHDVTDPKEGTFDWDTEGRITTLSNYLKVGEAIENAYKIPKNEQNEELFDFKGFGIREDLKNDPGKIVPTLINFYVEKDKAELKRVFKNFEIQ